MRESGYYPPGAEHDPRAPYNEPEFIGEPIVVNIECSINVNTRQELGVLYSYEDEDECGIHLVKELVGKDYRNEIAENELVLPDLLWKRIEEVKPKKNKWVIFKIYNRFSKKTRYVTDIFSDDTVFDISNETTMWQYVNEYDYEIELSEIKSVE